MAFSFSLFSHPIKSKLESELKTTYLESLESEFGYCQDNNCLTKVNGHMKLQLPEKSLCFPYTNCGYYNCMEEQYSCSKVDIDYFTKLAAPTCGTYVNNIKDNKFSKTAQEWIYTVMVCLQKGLTDECEVHKNCEQESDLKTCEYITDFTLKFHPSCYIESGVGVCNLPLKDKIQILKTVGPYLTGPEYIQAFKVVLTCLNPFA